MRSSVLFIRSQTYPLLHFFLVTHWLILSFFKETKLLFDELNFCLQRLYSIPFHVDMPFNDSILEEITTAEVRTPFSLNSFQRNLNLKGFPSSPEPGALCQLIIVIWKRISVKSNYLRIYKKRKHCANCLVVFFISICILVLAGLQKAWALRKLCLQQNGFFFIFLWRSRLHARWDLRLELDEGKKIFWLLFKI